ncbi:hypothetical protein SDC9_138285 [bioreactor metagenome]|uniref:Uncharacterized protein n=1 Tax=bioreactor metagenome TaxID=1076179 RepID=A0A645DPV7_9ZZZZ
MVVGGGHNPVVRVANAGELQRIGGRVNAHHAPISCKAEVVPSWSVGQFCQRVVRRLIDIQPSPGAEDELVLVAPQRIRERA